MKIPLARSDYKRSVAKEARALLRNRYFEQNPILTADQVALIARPGLKRFINEGGGPVRATYSQAGSFNDAAFFVSGTTLYRLDKDGTVTLLKTNVGAANPKTAISMAATARLGSTPEFLFIADGSVLLVYTENGYAQGTLTASGNFANGEQVRIGSVYYQFTSGSVDAGAPAGTAGNPWLIALAGSVATDLTRLMQAINATGTPGTTYSTALVLENPDASATSVATQLFAVARAIGTAGNSVATTETGANASWGGATMSGGGSPSITQVVTPDDVGVADLGYIASHVLVIPAQGQGINGRFYWIEPGSTEIDPLNFATAERAPDPVLQVKVFGDQFWLTGISTTETWIFSGDPNAPVQRLQGIVYDRGSIEGTAVVVKDSLIIVDPDGSVSMIGRGGIKPIGRPDVAERIRTAYQKQKFFG